MIVSQYLSKGILVLMGMALLGLLVPAPLPAAAAKCADGTEAQFDESTGDLVCKEKAGEAPGANDVFKTVPPEVVKDATDPKKVKPSKPVVAVNPGGPNSGDDPTSIANKNKEIEKLQKEIDAIQAMIAEYQRTFQAMDSVEQQKKAADIMSKVSPEMLGGLSGFDPKKMLEDLTGGKFMGKDIGKSIARNFSQGPGNGTPGNSSPGSYKDVSGITSSGVCDPKEHKPMTEQQPDTAAIMDISGNDNCTKQAQKAGIANIDASKCLTTGGGKYKQVGSGDATKNANTTTVAVRNLIMKREGWRNDAYPDGRYPSIGIGHNCYKGECKLGDRISNEQVLKFFAQDIKERWAAAKKQMDELGINDHCFFTHLTSVNFQLGTAWHTAKFPTAWRKMKEGDFSGAIQIVAGSKWARQTPVRTNDFIASLKGMIGQKLGNGTVIK